MSYSFQNKASSSAVTVGELNQVVNDISFIPTLQQVLDFNHDLIDDNNFQGTDAGLRNTGTQVLAHGTGAATDNEGTLVIAIGDSAASANKKDNVTAIGQAAASKNEGEFVNAIGYYAAYENQGDNVIALGANAAETNLGSNVIALGSQAGAGNPLSGMFIVANTELPSYADYAAASAAISPTGVTGNTYLYHDQATNSIGAVRL